MKYYKLIFNSLFISLFLIAKVGAQETTNNANYLLSTFSKNETLSSGKEIIELPNPRGPHLVGTTVYHWIDRSREEKVTDEDHDFRQVIAQVWYPAMIISDNAPAAYFPEIGWLRAGFRTQKGDIFVKFEKDFERYNRVLTSSSVNPPIDGTQDKYPLLIFSTGGNMSRHWYTGMMQELASHGFIAVAISHPYSSLDFFPGGGLIDDYPHWRASEDATDSEREQLEQLLINLLAEDAIFVLDKMISLNQSDSENLFTGRIDTEKFAIMGHSRGGSTVTRAAFTDDRFKAAIIYDNIGSEPETEIGINQPLLSVRRPWSESRTESLHNFLIANKSFSREVVIDSASHFTFSDMTIVNPENYESKGNPLQLHNTVMDYTLDFLNHTFYGEELKVLNDTLTARDGVSTRKFNPNE